MIGEGINPKLKIFWHLELLCLCVKYIKVIIVAFVKRFLEWLLMDINFDRFSYGFLREGPSCCFREVNVLLFSFANLWTIVYLQVANLLFFYLLVNILYSFLHKYIISFIYLHDHKILCFCIFTIGVFYALLHLYEG